METHRQSEDILIDTGDILQGSPLAYYLSKKSLKNHPFSDVLNAMNYNAFTLGNHDFNFGKNTLKSFTKALNAPILNANILKDNLPWLGQKTLIKELSDGLTMGIIGVTTHYIPKWENPLHIDGLVFKDVFETLKEEVKKLRDKVDLLIVNYHGGFEGDLDSLMIRQFTGENQGIKIIKEMPEIDILLTGHQHQILTQIVGNTYVSQPGQKGEVLNAITIHASLDEKWTFEYEGSSIKCDQENISLKRIKNIQTVHHQTLNYLEQVIGRFDQDYLIEDPIESRVYATPIASWINQMQLEETNAELSLCSLGNEVSGFYKEVTLKSLLSTYLYPNTLVVKSLSKRAILEAIEKTAEIFDVIDDKISINNEYLFPKKMLYQYDFWWPLEVVINVSKPKGQRIESLTLNGKPLENRFYQVAMNNYRASGGGEYPMIETAELVLDTQKEIVMVLLEALEKNPMITLSKQSNITIKK